MRKYVGDLFDIFGDIHDQMKASWSSWKRPIEAPPTTRDLTVAFVPLIRESDGQHVGCFVPELYELAKAGFLSVQHSDPDHAKTPFELAIVPFKASRDEPCLDELRLLAEHIQREFHFIQNHPDPTKRHLCEPIQKFTITPNYLAHVKKLGLKVMPCLTVSVTLQNLMIRTSLKERALYYIAQRLALLLTLSTIFTLGASSFGLTLIGAMGALIAQWCMKEMSNFGVADHLYREWNWISCRAFWRDQRISPKNTLKTVILGLALFTVVGFAAMSSWESIMKISFELSSPFLSHALSFGQYALAAIITTIESLSILLGGLSSLRFYWGFSIWDHQFVKHDEQNPEIEEKKNIADNLPEAQTYLQIQQRAEQARDDYKQQCKAKYKAKFGSNPVLTPGFEKAKEKVSKEVENQAVAQDIEKIPSAGLMSCLAK